MRISVCISVITAIVIALVFLLLCKGGGTKDKA